MGKNILICCDGTGNEYGLENTNVVKLFEIVKKDPGQIAYYDPGVGTFSSNAAVTRLGRVLTKLWGNIAGAGLVRNIEDAYEFLMDHYEPDDKVYLFGFSRGAFTVRALAAMISKCGLLEKGSKNLIPYATAMYRKKGNATVAEGFKRTFSRPCNIHFVGVWDTVKSVGLIWSRTYPGVKSNPDIVHFRHALAIDEKRWKFKPTPFHFNQESSNKTFVSFWFVGVHSDVGGSYKEPGLSNIALHWMIRQAADPVIGLQYDETILAKKEYEENAVGKLHNSLLALAGNFFPWFLIGWCTRVIPKGANIHPTVQDRISKDTSYRPKNLP